MRKCVSCQRDIPDDRRKDARYCNNAACRGREYRKRRALAAEAAPQFHSDGSRESMLLHCPCGKSYLLHGDNLEARELGPALSLTPTTTESTFVTQPVPHTEAEVTEAGIVPKLAAPDLDTATQTVLHTELEAADPAPAAKRAAPDLESITQTALHTEPEAREPALRRNRPRRTLNSPRKRFCIRMHGHLRLSLPQCLACQPPKPSRKRIANSSRVYSARHRAHLLLPRLLQTYRP